MRHIAILPTGDWAEINDGTRVEYVTLDDGQFFALCDGVSDNTILQLHGLLQRSEIDAVLGITRKSAEADKLLDWLKYSREAVRDADDNCIADDFINYINKTLGV